MSQWKNRPAALFYVHYEMNGKNKKFMERGDGVDQRIERLESAGLKVLNVEKKRET